MKLPVVVGRIGAGDGFVSRAVFTKMDEGDLKPLLDAIVARFPGRRRRVLPEVAGPDVPDEAHVRRPRRGARRRGARRVRRAAARGRAAAHRVIRRSRCGPGAPSRPMGAGAASFFASSPTTFARASIQRALVSRPRFATPARARRRPRRSRHVDDRRPDDRTLFSLVHDASFRRFDNASRHSMRIATRCVKVAYDAASRARAGSRRPAAVAFRRGSGCARTIDVSTLACRARP